MVKRDWKDSSNIVYNKVKKTLQQLSCLRVFSFVYLLEMAKSCKYIDN